ncbi:hypothetical protein Tco_0195894 [Tanacetum coccineum]
MGSADAYSSESGTGVSGPPIELGAWTVRIGCERPKPGLMKCPVEMPRRSIVVGSAHAALRASAPALSEASGSALLVHTLSDANEDECFDPGGDVDGIELLLHRDPSTPKISVASILEGFTDEPPLEENDDLFDLESKENEWKKILYDAPIDDLMTEDKIFDPGIHEKIFSPTYVSLPFEDRHYLSLTYVI